MLTRRLSATTKLVGPVISCEGAPFKGQSNDKWKLNPAVQSYAVAMDQVGGYLRLQVLYAYLWLGRHSFKKFPVNYRFNKGVSSTTET